MWSLINSFQTSKISNKKQPTWDSFANMQDSIIRNLMEKVSQRAVFMKTVNPIMQTISQASQHSF